MNQARLFRYFTIIQFLLMGLWTACSPSAITPTTTKQGSASTNTPAPSKVVIADKPHPNFAFYFEYGACLLEFYDSFNGTFTRSMGPSETAISIPLDLTAEQMESIYQQMMAIDLFSYPSDFGIPTPVTGSVAVVTPAYHYFIRIRNGDMMKTVSWTDNIVEPTTPEADQLRQLFQAIIAVLRDQEDVKKLPMPNLVCV
jgi:hypothetical protein